MEEPTLISASESPLAYLFQTVSKAFPSGLIFGLGFGLLGVVFAFLSAVEYKSEVQIMPELQNRGGGNLRQFSALAELAGVSLGGGSNSGIEAVRPDLYPDIIQSTPFTLYLLGQTVTDSEGKRYRLADMPGRPGLFSFMADKTPVFGPIVTTASGNERLIMLTKKQKLVVDQMKKRVVALLDKRTGIISITVKMPDANVAAQVAQKSVDYIRTYVGTYRTEKARKDELFLSHRVQEAKRRYESAERSLFGYRDKNRYLVTQSAGIEGRRLEAEYLFSQTLFNDLNRQLEQAHIRVQEETPVFKVLEPAQVPTVRSEPQRTLMVIGFTLVGFVLGLLVFILRRSAFTARAKPLPF
jgi:uncharacterized protein involved in exopolysaccharide biosynthesis